MGHIKEPDGVDFVIKSRPLTNEEELAISNYIRAYKAKHSPKKAPSRGPQVLQEKKLQIPWWRNKAISSMTKNLNETLTSVHL